MSASVDLYKGRGVVGSGHDVGEMRMIHLGVRLVESSAAVVDVRELGFLGRPGCVGPEDGRGQRVALHPEREVLRLGTRGVSAAVRTTQQLAHHVQHVHVAGHALTTRSYAQDEHVATTQEAVLHEERYFVPPYYLK